MTTMITEGNEADEVSIQEAERDAARLLSEAWRPRGMPVDPFQIARGLGIDVHFFPLPSDVSGRIEIVPNKTPAMWINQHDSASRRRFTCAHEIGHYLRRSEGSKESFVDYRDTLAGLGVDGEEIAANQFAAALLMPAEETVQMNAQGFNVEQMALAFGTSTQAMQLRLKNLRLR